MVRSEGDARRERERYAWSVDPLQRDDIDDASFAPVNEVFDHFAQRRASGFNVEESLVLGETAGDAISEE